MLNTTVSCLICARCGHSELKLHARERLAVSQSVQEVRSGELECPSCSASFPILAGVAVVVEDVRLYLLEHVKGIAQVVPDEEIPAEFLDEYLEAKSEIQVEHIEEDLEAERVTSLYLMNHYLRAGSLPEGQAPWWRPEADGPEGTGRGDPLIDSLVRQYWDHGPLARIQEWVKAHPPKGSQNEGFQVVELGCGVGGMRAALKPYTAAYLGVDSSFASIALARHLALGFPYQGPLRIPGDLLEGPVSREAGFPRPPVPDALADFVVGDLTAPPLVAGAWDLSIALNAIDMLDEPRALPELQSRLLKAGGIAIQSCPYIWHQEVARHLRELLPEGVRDSARAVEWLYEQAGFRIEEAVEHLPWLFFKHLRQLEIYSVHLFRARRQNQS